MRTGGCPPPAEVQGAADSRPPDGRISGTSEKRNRAKKKPPLGRPFLKKIRENIECKKSDEKEDHDSEAA